jgi:glycosyltransferase involved in cell wall biosynthesis
MKILFAHDLPFHLAHGGCQTYIEGVMRGLANLGETVEPQRWWDEQQTGDILHYVGRRPSTLNVNLAHQKGFKVVMTEFLDLTSSRARSKLLVQKFITRLSQKIAPGLLVRLSWDVYQALDAYIYCAPHELEVAHFLFNADYRRGHIIGHGLEIEALAELAKPQPEEDYLVSLATITPRKNTNLLAEAARAAQVPIWFLGKSYAEDDAYFRQFQSLVDGQWVRYGGFVTPDEKYRYFRGARGFALLSQFESGCIAVYEAAAAGLPLFLSDLPWATRAYPEAQRISFTPLNSPAAIATRLKEFYASAHRLPGHNFPVLSWRQVAEKIRDLYRQLLRPKESP